ncbi:unnamed protein product [Plutella xylostella]|uniref:(diamondback moth) hypothetical protein n=1 Tax=Plutella xylostella TaxID=51655 RepID=A0A8S4EDD2_PLUXY|nr:unnamed protein product [Plutella xylostella]
MRRGWEGDNWRSTRSSPKADGSSPVRPETIIVCKESGNKEVRPRRAASGDWHRSTTARGRGRRRRGVAESGDGGASRRAATAGRRSGAAGKETAAEVHVCSAGALRGVTYLVVMPVLCFIIPACLPVYLWGEDPWTSWYVASVWRYTLSLNFTWLVNSAAHIYGNRPYDKYIGATDNKTVGILAMGEGWHNYHHVFPWDYKAAELGNYSTNLSTAVIDIAAKYGWAYDLKTVSEDMIRRRVNRTGDGSHPTSRQDPPSDGHHHPDNPIWGWDDQDMTVEDRQFVEISHKKSD